MSVKLGVPSKGRLMENAQYTSRYREEWAFETAAAMTARAEALAGIMGAVDSTKTTCNLWGERWTKLIINSMNNAASAATGLSSSEMAELKTARRLSIRLGGEAIHVGVVVHSLLEERVTLEIDHHLATLVLALGLGLEDGAERETRERAPPPAQAEIGL